LAMMVALRIACHTCKMKYQGCYNQEQQRQFYSRIYSDSKLIVNFWSKGRVNPETLSKMDKNKRNIIQECTELRKEYENVYNGKIIRISGDDNLADLGFHQSKKRKGNQTQKQDNIKKQDVQNELIKRFIIQKPLKV